MTYSTKLCECGCEAQTNLDPKGNPRRFLHGHNRRGTSLGWEEQGRWFVSIGGKKKPFHRYLVEEREGRTLDRNEVVHHIDGNAMNNALDNLMVLSRAEHFRIHMLAGRPLRWTAEERARALALSDAGMKIDPVSRVIGRSYAATRDQLRKLRRQRSLQSIEEKLAA
jgi:hypothetical protein